MDKFNELYLLNDDIKLDIPNDIEDYSYNEIRSYIKETSKELSNLLNLYFLNDERNYFFWEAIDNANLNSFDTIKKWVKNEGLDKFCKEEKINKNNINIDSAMDYLNILLSDKIEGFLDDFKATYRYELKKILQIMFIGN